MDQGSLRSDHWDGDETIDLTPQGDARTTTVSVYACRFLVVIDTHEWDDRQVSDRLLEGFEILGPFGPCEDLHLYTFGQEHDVALVTKRVSDELAGWMAGPPKEFDPG